MLSQEIFDVLCFFRNQGAVSAGTAIPFPSNANASWVSDLLQLELLKEHKTVKERLTVMEGTTVVLRTLYYLGPRASVEMEIYQRNLAIELELREERKQNRFRANLAVCISAVSLLCSLLTLILK